MCIRDRSIIEVEVLQINIPMVPEEVIEIKDSLSIHRMLPVVQDPGQGGVTAGIPDMAIGAACIKGIVGIVGPHKGLPVVRN
jgi:hypothetical protein